MDKIKKYTQRLLLSRMRILNLHPFLGLLLMHLKFSVDEQVETACTDGERIIFGTKFLNELDDKELDFVMLHEVMHVVLQHWSRMKNLQHEEFNIACDIVVNSNILKENDMNLSSITLKKYGESMHLAPNKREGYEYTAEELYQMLIVRKSNSQRKGKDALWDDHSQWGKNQDNSLLRDMWEKRLMDAYEAISIRDKSNGNIPLFAKRMLQELRKPQTDWRTILNDFVQEDVVDYSFMPPDRRFDDSDFFLPDFNEKDERVEDILFMIDTSGSMSDEMIAAAYSEVRGAIEQFYGRLKGWLGFFDAAVIPPQPFETEEEFRVIHPEGGGGTNFSIIFQYIQENMEDKLPASIIILTDGYAAFPKEGEAMGIPVLWLLNNDEISPPWGKVARITVD